ncbi:MAG: YcaO-like family protein [Rhabdochlamydiaceae bacterium]|nr:YcaO-like family protein [Rhabdochlamydiaceae bacterium]
MQPIFYRGQRLTATKVKLSGTHRTTSAEDTWEKVAPLAPKIGITRVANITGLDRLSIPVTSVVRPTSKTLAISSGKGTSLIIAQVSGFMESLELYCAEEHDPEPLHLPYNELIKHFDAIDLSLLPLRKNSLFHPSWPERWVLGWDLFIQKEVAIPLLSVTLNAQIRDRIPTELFSFRMDSNGLASGNHFAEALTSAIYELIERDAITCHDIALEHCGFFSPRVRLETITYPSVRELLDKLAHANIECFLYDCTIDTAVPVFKAYLYDPSVRHREISGGYGAHLDPEVAMIRAITEAVQGRTVYISGSRDDIFSQKAEFWEIGNQIASLQNQPATIDAKNYQSQASCSFEGDLYLLMSKLKDAGLNQLIVYDLSQQELGVFVVRALIPGLEAYHNASHAPGYRALRFAAAMNNHSHVKNGISTYGAHSPAGGLID